jgi:hypothetical protein
MVGTTGVQSAALQFCLKITTEEISVDKSVIINHVLMKLDLFPKGKHYLKFKWILTYLPTKLRFELRSAHLPSLYLGKMSINIAIINDCRIGVWYD